MFKIFVILLIFSLNADICNNKDCSITNNDKLENFKFICDGDFALCAASTCTPTGNTITLNNGHVKQEVACRCPILNGKALAYPNGGIGNMKGSCDPSSPNNVWSLFSPRSF